jgi:hypothetical protein
MITSKTDICNLALGELGARRIVAYETEASVEARSCRLHLDQVVNTLLRRHQWNFATMRAMLSRLADAPLSEWAAAWQVPADLVRLIRLSSGDSSNPIRDFTIEGRKLLSADYPTLEILYVSSAVEPVEWDALFVDAVAYKLASRIAPDVTQNPALGDAALQRLEALALPQAQTADAREVASGENFGPRQLASMSGLVNARFGNGRPPYIPTN